MLCEDWPTKYVTGAQAVHYLAHATNIPWQVVAGLKKLCPPTWPTYTYPQIEYVSLNMPYEEWKKLHFDFAWLHAMVFHTILLEDGHYFNGIINTPLMVMQNMEESGFWKQCVSTGWHHGAGTHVRPNRNVEPTIHWMSMGAHIPYHNPRPRLYLTSHFRQQELDEYVLRMDFVTETPTKKRSRSK
jgi:hypothetical protein